MKKFLALLAVLALTVVSSVAFAEVTVSGSVDIRNLATNNTTDYFSGASDEVRNTQERIRINVDAKHEGVSGRVTIENDWDVWGRVEAPQGASVNSVVATSATTTAANDAGRLKIREGWINFSLPVGVPNFVKVGHQFLQLGNAWFFRSQKYGSDAWLVGFPGRNTVAFVDVKAAELNNAGSDDVDALVLLDMFKIDDNNLVGAYFARLRDPQGKFLAGGGPDAEANLDTLGLHYGGKVGPVKLQAEFDMQSGSADIAPGNSVDFSGTQWILQANVPLEALTINATIASGSGDDATTAKKQEGIQTLLDADPHYTFVYEYFVKTAAGKKNTGFANTQAVSLGASFAVTKNLTVGLDYWMLTANEKCALNGGTASDDIGSELDAKILWKLNDNLSWNWQLGRLMPGKVYENAAGKADNVDAVQGILSYKF